MGAICKTYTLTCKLRKIQKVFKWRCRYSVKYDFANQFQDLIQTNTQQCFTLSKNTTAQFCASCIARCGAKFMRIF